jgi:Permease family
MAGTRSVGGLTGRACRTNGASVSCAEECGIATLVRPIGVWKFGIRMPVTMGVTFASVGPMLAMDSNPEPGLLGIFPKIGHVVASVPQFVLGGAGIVMFGMVAATGIKILGGVDFASYQASPYVIATSVGFGMIPLVSDKFFQSMPKPPSPFLHSGILLVSISAVVLNVYFNGLRRAGEAAHAAASGAHQSEVGRVLVGRPAPPGCGRGCSCTLRLWSRYAGYSRRWKKSSTSSDRLPRSRSSAARSAPCWPTPSPDAMSRTFCP